MIQTWMIMRILMNLQEMLRFEWCTFYDQQTNVKEKRSGAKVGSYMACSGYKDKWKLYEVLGGMPVINCWICSLDDAVKIGEVIDKAYGDFLGIYGVWLKCDVIRIASLSVPDGLKIYNAVQALEKLSRIVSYQDFMQLLKGN